MAKTGDSDLWQAALRDVKPLRRRRPHAAPKPTPKPSAPISVAAPSAPAAARPAAGTSPKAGPLLPLTGLRSPGLDKASAERLKRGQYPIEARIDLHGMTQDDAHRMLGDFIARSARAGLRCVLVITGKGLRRLEDEQPGGADSRRGEVGILRNAAPRWLNEAPNRARILAFSAAQPRHGGSGALYVLLRRRDRGMDGRPGEG
jgi:DNA-nicking Smr family endonuclease